MDEDTLSKIAFKEKLKTMHHDISYNIQVPFTSGSYFPALHVHTNEIFSPLRNAWTTTEKAYNEIEVKEKPKRKKKKTKKLVQTEASDNRTNGNLVEMEDGCFEIREDYVEGEEENISIQLDQWSKQREKSPKPACPSSDIDEFWDRLEKAEENNNLDVLDQDYQESVLQRQKEEGDALKAKGNECFKIKDYENAEIFFSKACQLCPNNAVYHSNHAAALFAGGHYNAAVVAADRAIASDPKWPKGFYRKSLALIKLNRNEEAISCVDSGLQLVPHDRNLRALKKQASAALQQPSVPVAAQQQPKGKETKSAKVNTPTDATPAFNRQIVEHGDSPPPHPQGPRPAAAAGGTSSGEQSIDSRHLSMLYHEAKAKRAFTVRENVPQPPSSSSRLPPPSDPSPAARAKPSLFAQRRQALHDHDHDHHQQQQAENIVDTKHPPSSSSSVSSSSFGAHSSQQSQPPPPFTQEEEREEKPLSRFMQRRRMMME